MVDVYIILQQSYYATEKKGKAQNMCHKSLSVGGGVTHFSVLGHGNSQPKKMHSREWVSFQKGI